MTNYSHGRAAEEAASKYLATKGYKILGKNWRTKYCEIDIVAVRKKIAYFVEVKYRQSDSYGTGLEYITPKKIKQMVFAAEMWVNDNSWNHDYVLAAIEVAGADYRINEFLPDIQSPLR